MNFLANPIFWRQVFKSSEVVKVMQPYSMAYFTFSFFLFFKSGKLLGFVCKLKGYHFWNP